MLRKIKPNDRKAKRFRYSAGRINVLNKELFEHYKELYPKTEIDYKTFKLIIKVAHDVILDIIINDRDGYQFPFMLGYIFVGSYIPVTKPVDHKKSLEIGYEVRHNNYETDGRACKIFYSSYASKYKLVNRQLWKFTPHRNFKDTVSSNFKKNYKLYKEINRGDNAWKKIILQQ